VFYSRILNPVVVDRIRFTQEGSIYTEIEHIEHYPLPELVL